MSAPDPPKPRSRPCRGEAKRRRSLLVMWSLALGLLITLALVCWLVVVPVLDVRKVLNEYVEKDIRYAEDDNADRAAIAQLGGREAALRKLHLYVRLPSAFVPHRSVVPELMDHCGPAAIGPLADILKNDTRDMSSAAAEALAEIGKPAVPALVEALRHENDDVRFSAVNALAEMNLDAEEALPALLGMLGDRDKRVRARAVDSLEAVGRHRPEVVGPLISALRDPAWEVRNAAAQALEGVRLTARNAAVPALSTVATEDAHVSVRYSALRALYTMAPRDEAAMAAFEKAGRDDDELVREAAAEILRDIRRRKVQAP